MIWGLKWVIGKKKRWSRLFLGSDLRCLVSEGGALLTEVKK